MYYLISYMTSFNVSRRYNTAVVKDAAAPRAMGQLGRRSSLVTTAEFRLRPSAPPSYAPLAGGDSNSTAVEASNGLSGGHGLQSSFEVRGLNCHPRISLHPGIQNCLFWLSVFLPCVFPTIAISAPSTIPPSSPNLLSIHLC